MLQHMVAMIRQLVSHKWHANAAMLKATRSSETAVIDAAILQLLQHMLVANRFWLLTMNGGSFARELEQEGMPETFDALAAGYQRTCSEETEWLSQVTDADLQRLVEDRQIPVGRCSVMEGVLQVVLHTQGHRSQLAKMLRGHGITPPMTDFITWVGTRSAPDWSQ